MPPWILTWSAATLSAPACFRKLVSGVDVAEDTATSIDFYNALVMWHEVDEVDGSIVTMFSMNIQIYTSAILC